jgi:predicted GNAT superfamily acetyltransferase
MGFRQIPDVPCLFTSRVIIIFFYVDDIAVLNRKEDRAIAKKFKADLYQKYKLKDKEKLKCVRVLSSLMGQRLSALAPV